MRRQNAPMLLSPEKGIHAWTYNINDNKISKITENKSKIS
jgi:hypothetical protein